VQTKRLSVPVNLHRYSQIAEITIHPQRIPTDVEQIDEYVNLFTSSNRKDSALQIPFYSRVVHGSLDYVRAETMLDMSSSSSKKSHSTAETSKCRPVHVINRFRTNIAVLNVSSSHPELLASYVEVRDRFFPMDPSLIVIDLDKDADVLRISPTGSLDELVLSHSSSKLVAIETVQ
jgi:hypothetical protein